MTTCIRRSVFGVLVLVGLLAGQSVANAQFAFGWTRYGYNPSNPFVAQQQYIANLQANQYAIRAGASVPAWLPYVTAYRAPYVYAPYYGTGYGNYGYTGYGYTAPLYNPYMYGYGYYGNPYSGSYYSNPYSAYGW